MSPYNTAGLISEDSEEVATEIAVVDNHTLI